MATKPKTETRETDRHGVVREATHLALDVVDRTQSTVIAVLQDARTELRPIVDQSIDLAEKSATGLFRFARKLTQRVDEGSGETLAHAERKIGGAVKSARETAKAAADSASAAPADHADPTAKA